MKTIMISSYGDADVLKLSDSAPKPSPSAGQVLGKIHAAGVNFVDIYQRRGTYPIKLPYIPGLEGSGVVVETGDDVTGFRVNDRVAYTGHIGSYSEYTTIEAARIIPLPDDMSFEQGAAFPLQGMTAHYLIHEFRKPKAGDAVLIHAAAGGVGLLLVQWAKRLGATAIGTVSNEEKARAAEESGADHVIIYTKQDFARETMRLTDGRGAQLIIDGKPDDNCLEDIRKIAEGVAGVEYVHEIRCRRSGQYLIVDLKLDMNPEMTVSKSHNRL